MAGATETERVIMERVSRGVHERLRGLSSDEAARIDATWIADAMLDAMPARHPFEGLGPFYDTPGLTRWLGVSRQALHQKVQARQLLACVTGDGQRVYPAWQFTADRRVLVDLPAVLGVLLGDADPWTVAVWLTTPSERLGGLSAIEALRRRQSDTVVAAATDDAARWAQ